MSASIQPQIVTHDVPKRGFVAALVSSLRPRQWTKNLLVFAALLFTLDVKHADGDIGRSVAAFAIFCLLSGATYIFNDLLDRDADRHHPTKKLRPIAAGQISPAAAGFCAAVIGLGSLACAFHLSTGFGVSALAYAILTAAYSIRLKHIVLIDVMALAAGFVIRAVAGAVVIDVRISQWLLLCTGLLALFLSIGKRRGELVAVLGGRKVGREVIGEYSIELLDQMSTIVTSALVMSYALYTIQSEAAVKHPYLRVTLPFVIFGIFRYLYLIHRKNQGESPDEVVLRDHQLIATVILWGIATAVVILNKL